MRRTAVAIAAAAGVGLAVLAVVATRGESTPADSVERRAQLDEVVLSADAAELAQDSTGANDAPTHSSAGSSLRISEIHYHPESDHPAEEFVEIVNVGSDPVTLAGWCVDGIGWCFAEGALQPGETRSVWTADADGKLSNGGELLELVAPDGAVADRVDYDDSDTWPAIADGHGSSLQRIDIARPGHPGNWIAMTPSPGTRPESDVGVMPVWSDVEFSTSLGADTDLDVVATVGGVASVRVEAAYRIGFDAERFLSVDVGTEGRASFTIPGQRAGALIRFRLIAYGPDGTPGTWPRQGDGAGYVGTTVQHEIEPSTGLPRIEWFMEQAAYDDAFDDLTLVGDTGRTAVFVIDGRAFDNSLVRVKGGSARGWPKPKWKVTLPAGHDATIPGVTDEPVDEFALHGSWNDKSFVREILSHDAMALAGLPVTHVAPVRVELNSEFYGLYNYVEQPDSTWRERAGLDDDAIVYEVGASVPGFFVASDADLSRDDLRLRYQRESDSWVDDDDELRLLLTDLTRVQSLDAAERREWILQHLDVPAFVNTLAVSSLIQHRDYWSKNFRIAYLPGEQRWTVIPFDLELTWGRTFGESCQSLCDEIVIEGEFGKPNSLLFGPFSTDPVLSDMVRRRMLTLVDPLLDAETVRDRTTDLERSLADDAALDRERWGTYGDAQPFPDAVAELRSRFVVLQYAYMLGPDSPAGLADVSLSPPEIEFEVTGVDGDRIATITNVGQVGTDLSGFEVTGFGALPHGLVIEAGRSVTVDLDGVVGWI